MLAANFDLLINGQLQAHLQNTGSGGQIYKKLEGLSNCCPSSLMLSPICTANLPHQMTSSHCQCCHCSESATQAMYRHGEDEMLGQSSTMSWVQEYNPIHGYVQTAMKMTKPPNNDLILWKKDHC